jgi:hypothetical protein
LFADIAASEIEMGVTGEFQRFQGVEDFEMGVPIESS